MRFLLASLFALLLAPLVPAAYAADPQVFTLTLHETQFEPAELTVPANQKIELQVVNQTKGPVEFESHDLHREKVVTAGRRVSLSIGPLNPGSYEFFNDFNPKVRGHLIAR
ncbi:MAG TPA: cupredoxin domain-containing protein [Acetobacteraceae bacterium]|nr:cupredoxin domain-containing protein [Acetobacteraceae bacterium]